MSDPDRDASAKDGAREMFAEVLAEALLLPLLGSTNHARHSVIAVRLARGAAGVFLDALEAVRISGARRAKQERSVSAFVDSVTSAKLARLRGLIRDADDGEPLIRGETVAAQMRERIAEAQLHDAQVGPDAGLLERVAAHYDDLASDATGIDADAESLARRRADELRNLSVRLAAEYAGQGVG